MEKYQNHPLFFISGIEHCFKQLRSIAEKYPNDIRIIADSNFEMLFAGLGNNSDFNFKVSNPQPDSKVKEVVYLITYSPKSTYSIETIAQKDIYLGQLQKILSTWIGFLQRYNSVLIHPEDEIHKVYEKNFDDWFEIIDEDIDKEPFDLPRQILIDKCLEESILLLKNEEIDESIINEAQILKENLSRSTIKNVISDIKSITTKVRLSKNGLRVFQKIYKVCTEQTIAMGFHLTISSLGESALKLLGL